MASTLLEGPVTLEREVEEAIEQRYAEPVEPEEPEEPVEPVEPEEWPQVLPHFFVDTSTPTAQERMKQSYGSFVAIGVVLSVLLHLVFLATADFDAMPDLAIRTGPPLEQLTIEQPFELPPPPEAIARPAVPVLSTDLQIDPEITIGSALLRDNPATELPPPPAPAGIDVSQQPTFTPYEVRPELRNGSEIQRLLERSYPQRYRDAGIGGAVMLWVFIDESGTVRNTRVVQSTGYPELDEIAQSVVHTSARFSPAYNRDTRVRVWIQIPVSFETRLQ